MGGGVGPAGTAARGPDRWATAVPSPGAESASRAHRPRKPGRVRAQTGRSGENKTARAPGGPATTSCSWALALQPRSAGKCNFSSADYKIRGPEGEKNNLIMKKQDSAFCGHFSRAKALPRARSTVSAGGQDRWRGKARSQRVTKSPSTRPRAQGGTWRKSASRVPCGATFTCSSQGPGRIQTCHPFGGAPTTTLGEEAGGGGGRGAARDQELQPEAPEGDHAAQGERPQTRRRGKGRGGERVRPVRRRGRSRDPHLGPVVAGRVREDVPVVVEAAGRDGLVQLFRGFQLRSGILVPEAEPTVGPHGGQGAVNRMEGDPVDLQGAAGMVRGGPTPGWGRHLLAASGRNWEHRPPGHGRAGPEASRVSRHQPTAAEASPRAPGKGPLSADSSFPGELGGGTGHRHGWGRGAPRGGHPRSPELAPGNTTADEDSQQVLRNRERKPAASAAPPAASRPLFWPRDDSAAHGPAQFLDTPRSQGRALRTYRVDVLRGRGVGPVGPVTFEGEVVFGAEKQRPAEISGGKESPANTCPRAPHSRVRRVDVVDGHSALDAPQGEARRLVLLVSEDGHAAVLRGGKETRRTPPCAHRNTPR